jgi:hypothetical protein
MKKESILWLVLIQWVMAFEWLHSAGGKWLNAGFISNIDKSLAGYADKTPYPQYAQFLTDYAVPNARVFGEMIRIGEYMVGIALVLGGLYFLTRGRIPVWAVWAIMAALLGGVLMNLNFFMAAGATSPSTWGVNVIMGLVQMILLVFYFINRNELEN